MDQSAPWEDFSVMQGGPLHRLASALGLPRSPSGFMGLGIALALLTWAPLLALTAAAHTLSGGSTVPFLWSVGTHVRLLLAIPLLFVAETMFDLRARAAIRAIARSEVVPAKQLPRLRQALAGAAWWRDAGIVEAALIAITGLLIVEGMRFDLSGALTTWRHAADGAWTPAGWWYGLFSLPWFQFLTWRWMARLLIWTQLLWRISRLELHLIPTHPDQSGGLAPLAWPHESLGWFSFAMSAILVGTFAEEVMQGQRDVHEALMPLSVLILLSTFVAVAPLLLFFPKLFESKHRGEHDYGILASSYTRAFDDKWVRGQRSADEHLLGSADIQSLADLAGSYDIVHHMRVVPFSRRQLLQLAAASLASAAPLVLFVVPLNELVVRGAQLLFPL